MRSETIDGFHPKPLILILSAVLCAGALTLGRADEAKPLSAQAKSPGEETETGVVYGYAGWNDPVMANVAIYSGRALLRHLQAADKALRDGRLGEARREITASADFATAIRQMMPFVVVVDQIDNAKNKLIGEDDEVVADDLLPIYASLDEMEAYVPELAKSAKAKVKQAEKHMSKGERKKAAEKLDEVGAEIAASTVYLPVLYISEQVAVARKALDKKAPDTKVAEQAVRNALDSLVVKTEGVVVEPLPGKSGQGAKK